MRMLLGSVALLLSAVPAAAQDGEPEERTARRLQELFNDKAYDDMYDLMAPSLQDRFTSQDFEGYFLDLRRRMGRWESSGPVAMDRGLATLLGRFQKGEQQVQFSLDRDGRIEVLRFDPPAGAPKEGGRNSVVMSLPFKGTWEVTRAAADGVEFSAVDDGGRRHRGDGTKNEHYFGWGKEVLAPADGVVLEAVDGVRDNEPGKAAGGHAPLGNFVILSHADGEISVLSHLMKGGVKVKAGDRVAAGKVVGKCGNSGDSSEPRLHLRLVDSENVAGASGLDIHFAKLKRSRDGGEEIHEDYAPAQADVVSP